jgi:hypothetical protein
MVNMTAVVVDTIGWIGSAMVVIAYAMNMYGKMAADSPTYYAFNILGSACLILNTIYHQAIPSAVVNIIWVGLAVVALSRKKR